MRWFYPSATPVPWPGRKYTNLTRRPQAAVGGGDGLEMPCEILRGSASFCRILQSPAKLCMLALLQPVMGASLKRGALPTKILRSVALAGDESPCQNQQRAREHAHQHETADAKWRWLHA
jgi:hypothetical protein